MVTETTYLSHDNVNILLLVVDGVIQSDLSDITKVTVEVDGTTIDSSINPTYIWWTDMTVVDSVTYDVLKLKLGASSIPKGRYEDCRLVVYDASNTNGLVWSDSLILIVK